MSRRSVFALGMLGYILVAIQLEERDLVASLGDDYRRYRQRVPMIIPFLRVRRGPAVLPRSAWTPGRDA